MNLLTRTRKYLRNLKFNKFQLYFYIWLVFSPSISLLLLSFPWLFKSNARQLWTSTRKIKGLRWCLSTLRYVGFVSNQMVSLLLFLGKAVNVYGQPQWLIYLTKLGSITLVLTYLYLDICHIIFCYFVLRTKIGIITVYKQEGII